MKWGPEQSKQVAVLFALQGGTVHFLDGWDDRSIAPYGETDIVGWVMHHLAAVDTSTDVAPDAGAAWLVRNTFWPVRAIMFYIQRGGHLFVVTGYPCYHAGTGGPRTLDGRYVPKDQGNRYLSGVEIESKGLARVISDTDTRGITDAEVQAAVRLAAAFCVVAGVSVQAIVNHGNGSNGDPEQLSWAGNRKIDTQWPAAFWRDHVTQQIRVLRALQSGQQPPITNPATVTDLLENDMAFRIRKRGVNGQLLHADGKLVAIRKPATAAAYEAEGIPLIQLEPIDFDTHVKAYGPVVR